MSQTYPLDPVIQRLHSYTSPADDTEKIVIINGKTGEVLQRKPLLKVVHDLRYYRVSTRNTAECEGPTCTVRDIRTGQEIHIKVVYEASCVMGHEVQVVQALYKDNHAGAFLNHLIEGWIQDFVRDQGKSEFIQSFFERRDALEKHLRQKANDYVGLSLDLSLSLENEDKLDSWPIKFGNIPVRAQDYDQELNIKFEAELHVDETRKINAVLGYSRLPWLTDLIKTHIQGFILKTVTLHKLCYETDSVRQMLIQSLNQILSKQGRRIGFLTFEFTDTPALPKEFVYFEHGLNCTIKKCPHPIRVEHKLQMALMDTGKFHNARINNLEQWVQQKLDRITQDILFEKTYVELLLYFDENEIKREMQKEAELIGYIVKQLIVIPGLREIVLPTDGFDISCKANFATHDTRVQVGLAVVVTGKIKDLTKVESYLNPQTDIFKHIEDEVVRETQRIMHGVDPERFYMRFRFSDREKESPVEQVLEKGITEKLVETFHADANEIRVILKILETDLTKRLEGLQAGLYEVTVTALPSSGQIDAQLVTFRIMFQVLGVHKDGWYTFRAHNSRPLDEEIEQIKRIIGEDLKAKLDRVPSHILIYKNLETMYEMWKVFPSTIQKIIDTFGLIIRPITFLRLETSEERASQNTHEALVVHQEEAERKAIQINMEADLEELQQLRRKLSDLQEADIPDDDPDMKQVKRRIEEVLARLSSYFDGKQLQRKQLGPPSLDDYSKDFNFNMFNNDPFMLQWSKRQAIQAADTSEDTNEEQSG